jgi:membrane protease YdiL (CAAX protease family)
LTGTHIAAKVCGMEDRELEVPNTEASWLPRIQALFEVLLVSGLVSSLVAVLPFARLIRGNVSVMNNAHLMAGYLMLEASVTFLLLLIILKLHRETPAEMGFRFTKWTRDSFIGLAIVPLLFVFGTMIGLLFQTFFPRYYLEKNPLTEVIRTPGDLLLLLLAALIAGGIKEEMQRAFILTRFSRHLGGATLGLIIWSAAFGAGHYVQGAQGMLSAGIFGLIFGIVYLARGSLVAPIVAHGAYNTIAILGYWFTLRQGP